jgi:hypothetical protein
MSFAMAGTFFACCATLCAAPHWGCEKPKHEFGTKESTETVAVDFVLRNTGDRTLEFGRLYACCGVEAELRDKKLDPGAHTTLHAKLSLLLLAGDVSKVLYIATNDPIAPTCRLEIAGKVTPVLDITPQSLLFADGVAKKVAGNAGDAKAAGAETGRGENQDKPAAAASVPGCKEVVLRWRKPGPFAVTKVTCNQPWLKAEAKAGERPDEWRLSVTLAPPLPRGVSRGWVTAVTDRPNCPPVMVPVTVMTPGAFKVTPSELVLAPVEPGTPPPAKRLLAIRAPAEGASFQVLRVELPVPEMKADVRPSADGRSAFITLSGIPDPRQLDGAQIRVFTDNAATPQVIIPIRCTVPSRPSAPP